MAEFTGTKVTDIGIDMIAQTHTGLSLIFTSVKLGDGTIDAGEDIRSLTGLKNVMLTLPINNCTKQGNGQVDIEAIVSNQVVDIGFPAREVGVYAKIGDNGAEQLYAYSNCGNRSDWIPDKNTPINENEFVISVMVYNAENISAILNDSIIYVKKEELINHNNDLTAHDVIIDDLKNLIDNSGLNLLKRNKTYKVGDIAYSPNLPSWARLECVQAGTTAADDIDYAQMFGGGVLLTDGSVIWIVDDVRDYLPVGTVIYLPILRPGYIKANGATVQRADYPRLIQFADKYSLWTDDTTANPWAMGGGDGSTTMVLPDYRGRVLQGGDDAAVLVAGLPNLIGRIEAIDADDGILFEKLYIVNKGAGRNTGLGNHWLHEFKASRYNPIYGASDTVQPPAIQLIPQIKY